MIRIFENGLPEQTAALRAALRRLRRAGLGLDELDCSTARDTAAVLGVWLHNPMGNPDEGALEGFAGTVLPVVADAPAAGGLPARLKHVNAFQRAQHGRVWPLALADELVRLKLDLRPERRLFVSYRRVDAAGIANQLWERLTRAGFDVFLDDVGVARGEDFQQSLWRWLVDVDAVVVLDTPTFHKSHWCMDEIHFAEAHNIGVIRVDLHAAMNPNSQSVLAGKLLAPASCQMKSSDIAPGATGSHARLTDEAVDKVRRALYVARGGMVARRVESLTALLEQSLRSRGEVVTRVAGGRLSWHRPGKHAELRACPFAPTPDTLARFRESSRAAHVYAVYDHPRAAGTTPTPLGRLAAVARFGRGPTSVRLVHWDAEALHLQCATRNKVL